MGKKEKSKKIVLGELNALPFGKDNNLFVCLKSGEKRNLKDKKSDKNSFMPIKITAEQVFLAEPDGKLIPDGQGQQKCDFLIYCQMKPQSCFIELKGENISTKEGYNPYSQISSTIDFIKKEERLKEIVGQNVEKHAFIVSSGRQKIPQGVELKERILWQKLIQKGAEKKKIKELVHYVKVTKSDRYSKNSQNGQIICSPKSPVEIPFVNE